MKTAFYIMSLCLIGVRLIAAPVQGLASEAGKQVSTSGVKREASETAKIIGHYLYQKKRGYQKKKGEELNGWMIRTETFLHKLKIRGKDKGKDQWTGPYSSNADEREE